MTETISDFILSIVRKSTQMHSYKHTETWIFSCILLCFPTYIYIQICQPFLHITIIDRNFCLVPAGLVTISTALCLALCITNWTYHRLIPTEARITSVQIAKYLSIMFAMLTTHIYRHVCRL